jgi:hypothetical protein
MVTITGPGGLTAGRGARWAVCPSGKCQRLRASLSSEGPALVPPTQHKIDGFIDAHVGVVQIQRIFGGLQGRRAADSVLLVTPLKVCAKVCEFSLNTL